MFFTWIMHNAYTQDLIRLINVNMFKKLQIIIEISYFMARDPKILFSGRYCPKCIKVYFIRENYKFSFHFHLKVLCSGDYSGIHNFVKNIHRNIIIGQKYPQKHNFQIFKNLNWPISFRIKWKWKFRDCNFVKKWLNFNSVKKFA